MPRFLSRRSLSRRDKRAESPGACTTDISSEDDFVEDSLGPPIGGIAVEMPRRAGSGAVPAATARGRLVSRLASDPGRLRSEMMKPLFTSSDHHLTMDVISQNKTVDDIMSSGTFHFQQRHGKLDVRRIGRIDIDKLIQTVDIDTIQVIIL